MILKFASNNRRMEIVPIRSATKISSKVRSGGPSRNLQCIVDIYKNKDLLEFFQTSIYNENDVKSVKMLLDSLEKFELIYHENNPNAPSLAKEDLAALLEFSLKNKNIRRKIVDSYCREKCLE